MENISAEKSQLAELQFKHAESTFQSNQNPTIILRNRLQSKYFFDFNFFLSKPVNQIIYQLTHRPVTQQFLDARMIAQEGQCLKRSYHYLNEDGEDQLFDRIKNLGKFYGMCNNYLKYEYPMMIITNTKSIFQKRQRRLKKIQAGEGSSDQTEQKSSFFCYSFDTQHFLKDLSNISRFYRQQKNQKNQVSFDSDVHDVYVNQDYSINLSRSQNQKQPLNAVELKSILKNNYNLDHLIYDYEQKQSRQRSKQNNNYSLQRQSLKNIINKHNMKSNRLIIDSQNQSLQKKVEILSKKIQEKNQKNISQFKKPNFLSSYLNLFQNKYRKIYLQQDHSNLGTTDLKTTTDQNDTTQRIQLKKIDSWIQKQKEEKLKNRRKIRQKAEQLLRQVRIGNHGE